MRVALIDIYNRGDLKTERIHFKANVNIDLRFYLVLDSFYTSYDQINAGQKNCYWFAPKAINAGEHVVLYTRAGVANVEKRPDGTVYHFMFRDLAAPLYKNPKASASIIEITDWVTSGDATSPFAGLFPAKV